MLSEEKSEKIGGFIKSNLMNFVVFITSFAYIFYGQIGLKKTDLTIMSVLTSSILATIVGLIIKQAIGENGITKGYSSDIWQKALKDYSFSCNSAVGYLDKIDNYYMYEEIRIKKEYRRKKLMQYRINYDWFFDDKGNYVENKERFDKLDKQQIKALKKCINVKIYNLNLTSEYETEEERLTRPEKTDKNQRAKMFRKNTFAQVFSAVAGAYFVPMINGWSWASFLVSTLQVCIWVSCGVVQLYANYNYVVIDKVNKLAQKKEGLARFIAGCKNGLYEKSPYED